MSHPTNRPIMIAAKKLRRFLIIAALVPKYLISSGRVMTPTIIRVVMNTATTVYDAPLAIREAAMGYDMNPGMSVIDPTIAAMSTPRGPDPGPRYRKINRSDIKYIAMLTRIRILRNGASIPRNILAPFLIPVNVLRLSIRNDTSNAHAVIIPKIRALLNIVVPRFVQ